MHLLNSLKGWRMHERKHVGLLELPFHDFWPVTDLRTVLLFHLKKFPHNLNIVVFECYYVLVGRSKVHDSYLSMVKNVENEPLSERGNIYLFLLLFQAKVEKCIQKHNDLKERLRQTNEEVKLLRPQFDAAKETLKEAKAVLRNRQNEFRKKESELRKLAKERDDISARIQELQKRSVVVFM